MRGRHDFGAESQKMKSSSTSADTGNLWTRSNQISVLPRLSASKSRESDRQKRQNSAGKRKIAAKKIQNVQIRSRRADASQKSGFSQHGLKRRQGRQAEKRRRNAKIESGWDRGICLYTKCYCVFIQSDRNIEKTQMSFIYAPKIAWFGAKNLQGFPNQVQHVTARVHERSGL